MYKVVPRTTQVYLSQAGNKSCGVRKASGRRRLTRTLRGEVAEAPEAARSWGVLHTEGGMEQGSDLISL